MHCRHHWGTCDESAQLLLEPETHQGGLRKRPQILDAKVGGVLLWCVAALPPDAVGLHLVNSFQAQCVVWMLGIKRRPGEIGYACTALHELKSMRIVNGGRKPG